MWSEDVHGLHIVAIDNSTNMIEAELAEAGAAILSWHRLSSGSEMSGSCQLGAPRYE
jgi:hypothetical protein